MQVLPLSFISWSYPKGRWALLRELKKLLWPNYISDKIQLVWRWDLNVPKNQQINNLLREKIGQKGPPQIGLQEKYEGEALKESNDISPIFTPDDFIEFSSTY